MTDDVDRDVLEDLIPQQQSRAWADEPGGLRVGIVARYLAEARRVVPGADLLAMTRDCVEELDDASEP